MKRWLAKWFGTTSTNARDTQRGGSVASVSRLEPDLLAASALLSSMLEQQLQFVRRSSRERLLSHFHAKRDANAYLLFVFGACQRLAETFSDRERGHQWAQERRIALCGEFLPRKASERFIQNYNKLMDQGLQRAFERGRYAMDMHLRFQKRQIDERDYQRSTRELRRVMLENLEEAVA